MLCNITHYTDAMCSYVWRGLKLYLITIVYLYACMHVRVCIYICVYYDAVSMYVCVYVSKYYRYIFGYIHAYMHTDVHPSHADPCGVAMYACTYVCA
jgi:hypothetical protein